MSEFKQILVGIILFGGIITAICFFNGDNSPDLSRELPENTAETNAGHPLW